MTNKKEFKIISNDTAVCKIFLYTPVKTCIHILREPHTYKKNDVPMDSYCKHYAYNLSFSGKFLNPKKCLNEESISKSNNEYQIAIAGYWHCYSNLHINNHRH